MNESWKIPVTPQYGHLWLQEKQAQDAELGDKPKAFDTPFRYSDSGKCGRALAYSALKYPREPFDMAGTMVTTLGTEIHEKVQNSISNYFDASFEVPSQVITSSGSADGVIIDGEFRILLEIKTMGGTAFKKSIGLSNKGISDTPAGPRSSAILQAALNAVANKCHYIVIVHIGLEAVSKGLAQRTGLSEAERCVAEWIIPAEVFEPLADQEILRQTEILDSLNEGLLPERFAIGDDLGLESLSPEGSRQHWMCTYCSYLDACMEDGPGNPPVRVEIKEKV
jgi:hypothetical protein